ncbi:MAG: SDR family oxidoreductase [Candidatus Accumulibacter phosphatis]|uniref:Glucose 1-dehydrogenase 1 n=3 Tax=Candidatus Accumulibacter TaxID=327159 RepID=A0A080M3D5_9PROT|nr:MULTISPECIES: SDR family oxidoreductase [Candidatus Accumulibacter]KFB75561.1 MAG: Glucose 1-dehydrogenase 1 [Candidatus Accumulibacter cognatus]MCC2869702.1 SDR family oxidoreductase [Candidatus Accumulibacter phosphatis]MCM8578479.1 SDR family oxidoreductase [Accumulibacter sp.]MCM8620829.1 SDR family oxidoreductase [Accumulibacter sp.]MCQ1550855.1 SDR family oxidoreductase [Candidatus Accumulibacter phosphatis]
MRMHQTNIRETTLDGQRAIVTGANSGIGEAIAKGLAEAGATVVVNYVTDDENAQRVVDEICATGSRAFAIKADVSSEEQVQAMFQSAISELGSIDIVVNNAGLQQDAPFHEMTLAQWRKVIDVNLTGQFLCARAAVREFLRRGLMPQLSCSLGKIICLSSVHDLIPWAGHANYAASKGGVAMLMKTMAQELAMKKIRVNAISPGAIKTPINTSAWATAQAEAALLKLIPYYRVGETRDIARAAVWLASDHSDYVTGATLYVDGGMTLYPEFREGG